MNKCQFVIDNGYASFPVCKLTNKICHMMRRCSENMCWMPSGDMSKCKEIKEQQPKGSLFVRFKRDGKLYIEKDNHIVVVPYNKEDTPRYVFLIERKGKLYVKKA